MPLFIGITKNQLTAVSVARRFGSPLLQSGASFFFRSERFAASATDLPKPTAVFSSFKSVQEKFRVCG